MAVFKKEVFIAVAIIVDYIGFTPVLQRLHVGHLSCRGEFNGFFPTCHPPLVGSVTSRLVAVAIVGTAVHQIPIAHALTATVVGVVEVGIAQAMAELMTHRTDAIDVSASVEFSTTSISVDFHSVEGLCTTAIAITGCRREFPLMGPDGCGGTAIGFSLTCINHIYLVDLAIAVPVVVGKVHL